MSGESHVRIAQWGAMLELQCGAIIELVFGSKKPCHDTLLLYCIVIGRNSRVTILYYSYYNDDFPCHSVEFLKHVTY